MGAPAERSLASAGQPATALTPHRRRPSTASFYTALVKTLLGLAVVAGVLVGLLEPRRRHRDRVAATWAAETDSP